MPINTTSASTVTYVLSGSQVREVGQLPTFPKHITGTFHPFFSVNSPQFSLANQDP